MNTYDETERRDWLLGFAAAAPPLAWAAMLLLGSYVAEFTYSRGTRRLGHVWALTSGQFVLITVVAAGIIVVVAGLIAHQRLLRWRYDIGPTDEVVPVRRQRRAFIASAAVLSSYVFFFIVVLSGLPLIWFAGTR